MRIFGKLMRGLREHRGTLLFLTLMLAFRSSYADWLVVPTGSMNPTILEGDRIFTSKHAYGWRIPFTYLRLTQGDDPQRGEIAVFDSPKDGTRLVKRVIGVPGDTIEMSDEVLYINGQPLNYSAREFSHDILQAAQQSRPEFITEYLGETPHAIMLLPHVIAHRSFGPIAIPADRYLMLGDNRDNSADSRYFGLVQRELFVGRTQHLLLSLNPERYYLPRLERVWKPLI